MYNKDRNKRKGNIPKEFYMKRKYVPIQKAIEWGKKFYGIDDDECGISYAVSVSDMGYCKDGVTRWYHFDMDGVPCYTLKF